MGNADGDEVIRVVLVRNLDANIAPALFYACWRGADRRVHVPLDAARLTFVDSLASGTFRGYVRD